MNPDVILVFAFGTSDLVNSQIAQQADFLAQKYNVPVIAQEEALPDSVASLCIPRQQKYLSTLKVIKVLTQFRNRFKKVLVVAAPMQQKRCVRDLQRYGFEARVETGAYADWFTSWSWWYDKTSKQWWTRGRLRWWLREIPLRFMPWWLYEWLSG